MPTTSDAPLLDPATVHRTVLPNGLTVLVRRDTSAPVVAVNTFVRAGYFDETDEVVGVAPPPRARRMRSAACAGS